MQSFSESALPPQRYEVIRKTWLSQQLDGTAALLSAIATFLLVLGGLFYSHNIFNLRSAMPASSQNVFELGEFWRLWSTLFAHADPHHLLSNTFLFFILGSLLIGYFGLSFFPLTALFFGGLTNAIVLSGMPKASHLIGMSGVVFWMGGAWLTLYFLLDRTRSVWQRSLRSIGVGLALFVPAEAFDPQISYKSHLVGFILGVAWAFVYFFINRRKLRAAEVTETLIDE